MLNIDDLSTILSWQNIDLLLAKDGSNTLAAQQPTHGTVWIPDMVGLNLKLMDISSTTSREFSLSTAWEQKIPREQWPKFRTRYYSDTTVLPYANFGASPIHIREGQLLGYLSCPQVLAPLDAKVNLIGSDTETPWYSLPVKTMSSDQRSETSGDTPICILWSTGKVAPSTARSTSWLPSASGESMRPRRVPGTRARSNCTGTLLQSAQRALTKTIACME